MFMRVCFYHNIAIGDFFQLWKNKMCPGHILYGLTHLPKHGIHSIYHKIPFNPYKNRFKLMLYVLWKMLFSMRQYDVIYAVTFRGLELVILLRALGLFRKPIVIWHHTAVTIPHSYWRKKLSALFYRGIDRTLFFSEELYKRSVSTGKIKQQSSFVISWGGDLEYYDTAVPERRLNGKFITTGTENRDFVTLLTAFNDHDVVAGCNLYIRSRLKESVCSSINKLALGGNIHLRFGDWSLDECARFVNNAYAVVICCQDYPYTVGLTTLVEALALGKAVITTDNPTFPIDVEKEGIGIKVPYGDVAGWVMAINYMSGHPEEVKEMGRKARLLAERTYNLERCSKEVADVLLSLKA